MSVIRKIPSGESSYNGRSWDVAWIVIAVYYWRGIIVKTSHNWWAYLDRWRHIYLVIRVCAVRSGGNYAGAG